VSRLEDDIRRVMAGHDDEAPAAADLLRSLGQASPPRRRLGWYAPFLVAAAVAAVVAGSAWAGGLLGGHQRAPATTQGRPVPAPRLSCPASYAHQAPWVPAKPARVDGSSRLVPPYTPTSALICAYRGSNTAKQQAGWALSGRRSLADGLAGLAGQLTWQPRRPAQQIFCTLVGGPQTNYLIGLTYPGGARIWVAATDEPNECVSTSNGEFTSSGIVGPAVSKAFASGRWPPRQPVSCNGSYQDIGRLGQDSAMVPAGSTSVTICAPKARPLTLTSGYQALVSALNRLPARSSTRRCSGTPGPSTSYQVFFSYPEGPPIMVTILIGCHPAIDNLDLQADSASSVMPIIQQLLKPMRT
jgi:hypothetical protein